MLSKIQMEHAVEQLEGHANEHARKEFERLVQAYSEEQLRINREHCEKIEKVNRLKWFACGWSAAIALSVVLNLVKLVWRLL